jgi:transposase
VAPTSPLFVQQIREDHPDKTVEVWFQDEARIGQQGTLTTVWAQTGTRPRALKQTEYEWVYVFGAVNPVTGNSSAMIAPTVNTDYMNAHLAFISQQAGPDVQVVLVLDQAGWHGSKALNIPDNMTLLPLPPYSPELNPVERLWAYLKSHYLSNRVYTHYNHLLDETTKAWNQLTEEQLQSICNVTWIRHEI